MSCIQNKESIEQFCSFFEDEITKIRNLTNPLFQKIINISLMDAISRVWGHSIKGHRNRFISLLTDCIRWENSERVNIPMTFYRICENDPEINKELKNKFIELINQLGTGRIYRIEIDPLYSEISHLIKNGFEKKLVLRSRHAELLYTYRNHLIHEYRKPGNGMEFTNDNKTPYYHGMTDYDNNKETWELVYPTDFLINLSKSALNSVKTMLIEKDLNPYLFFKFGSPWRDNKF